MEREYRPDKNGVLRAGCLWRDVFSHVTSRWGFLVLIALFDGPLRFYLLRGAVQGISEKMLSQSLKLLIRDGLVLRTVEPTIPPQVTYELTSSGKEIAERLDKVSAWIGENVPHIALSQSRYDNDPR